MKYLTRDECWKIFLSFLKQRKIYSLYYKNYNNFCTRHKNCRFIKDKNKYTEWVLGAFSWSSTMEGLKFWDMIHKEWLNHIRNIMLND